MEQYFVKFAAICNYEKNGSESRALVEYSEHIQEESKKEDPVISKSDFSLNELRAGEKLFARSSEFILSVVENNGFPDISLPEIAFAGRSNVGKSSLINSLVGMKKLARVSNTPGRTQTINFFNQNDALVLVDLPGFGYAKASKDDITRWKLLTFDYLRGRVNLECVFLLIDSRHGIKPIDIEVMNILDEAAVSYQIVLTKLDKVKKESLNSLCNNTNSIISKHGAARPFFHLTSSKDNIGLLRKGVKQGSKSGDQSLLDSLQEILSYTHLCLEIRKSVGMQDKELFASDISQLLFSVDVKDIKTPSK